MNRNPDVIAQGIAAIGPYKLFIAARRQDADEEAARIQPKEGVSPPTPLWGSGSTAPLPFVTHTEEAEADGAEGTSPGAPRATAFIPRSGSEVGVPPGAQTTIESSPPPPEPPSVPSEIPSPPTRPASVVVAVATPPAGPSEGVSLFEAGVSEARVLPEASTREPSTVEAARAQFEAIWRMSPPEQIPRMVQEAYAERDRAPDYFAQKLIGAVREGLVSPALEAAVATLIRLDSHFQEADLLAHTPGHDQLFQIELQEADYHADHSGLSGDTEHPQASAPGMEDEPPQGEADRAALRGDHPF